MDIFGGIKFSYDMSLGVLFLFCRCVVLLTTYTMLWVCVIVILNRRMYWYEFNFLMCTFFVINVRDPNISSSCLKGLCETPRMFIVWFRTVQQDFIIYSPAL